MDNPNEQQQTNTETKAPALGRNGRTGLAALLLKPKADPTATPGNQSNEEGASASLEDAEGITLGIADPGTGIESSAGEGEGESDPVEDVYEFDGVKYTPAQVEEALREKDNNQRYNQSVTPLIDSINSYGEKAEHATLLAMTECDKVIAELGEALASGKLTSQQYQSAHMQLRDANHRKTVLESEAKAERELRTKALNQARAQNAKQTVVALTKAGWKREDILAVDGFAQKIMPREAYAEALNPVFMEILRDALTFRQGRDAAARKLQTKTNNALKTQRAAPKAQPAAPGKKSLGQLVFGDRK